MITERKNPIKRDHALNDSTSRQLGKDPRLNPQVAPPKLKPITRLEIHALGLLARCLEKYN